MTEDKILLTARYAEGDLSAEECLAYEDLLRHDHELKAYLLDYHDAHGSLRMFMDYDSERNALVAGIQKLNEAYFANESNTGEPKDVAEKPAAVKLKLYLRWVSGVAAILLVGLLVWSPWRADLYQEYQLLPNMSVTERGVMRNELDKAAVLFNERRFADAKPVLAKLYAADATNAMIAFHFAISLLETNEVAKGRLILADLFKGQSVYKNDAAYAIAMSYLKEDKKVDTRFWLEKVAKGAVQYKKAQALLKKLS
jgi:hypothetical protein